MTRLGVLGRAASAALALVLAGAACSGSGDSEAGAENNPRPGAATYSDPAGDGGGGLPDIRTIEVTSTPRGRITFRVGLANYTSRSKTAVDLWLDTDADPDTGNTSFAGADGADYQFSAFLGVPPSSGPFCGSISGGNGCLASWSSSGWVAANASTARVSRTAEGVSLSINRSDLGDTDELNFFAVRGGEEDMKDLLATGASRDEIRGGSEGSWTLELDGGRWSVRNLESGIAGRGTYTVDGNTLRLTVGSCTPANACGEIAEYTWSVYRDRLTLTRIAGRSAWVALVAKPWTRAR